MIPTAPIETPASHHRVRRTFATILGGFGVALLGLGLIALVLVSFVSSPSAAKSTTESVLKQQDVRNYLVDEIVKEIDIEKNTNSIFIDDNLPQGIYFVKYIGLKNTQTVRLVRL